MPNDGNGSMDCLPTSVCTAGSLGLDQFLGLPGSSSLSSKGPSPLNKSMSRLTLTVDQKNKVPITVVEKIDQEESKEDLKNDEECNDEEEEEEEEEVESMTATTKTTTSPQPIIAAPRPASTVTTPTSASSALRVEIPSIVTDDHQVSPLESQELLDPYSAAASGENNNNNSTTSTHSRSHSDISEATTPTSALLSAIETTSRNLTASSLALKNKQAEVEAAAAREAAREALAASVHAGQESTSLAARIKMFGGPAAPVMRDPSMVKQPKVKDIVKQFKKVEDKNLDEISHMKKSGNRQDCQFGLNNRPSTTALRPIPVRKMSHELKEGEVRGCLPRSNSQLSLNENGNGGSGLYGGVVLQKLGSQSCLNTMGGGGMATGGSSKMMMGSRGPVVSNEDDDRGVSQESVQSVKNAKSMFESLNTRAGAAM